MSVCVCVLGHGIEEEEEEEEDTKMMPTTTRILTRMTTMASTDHLDDPIV